MEQRVYPSDWLTAQLEMDWLAAWRKLMLMLKLSTVFSTFKSLKIVIWHRVRVRCVFSSADLVFSLISTAACGAFPLPTCVTPNNSTSWLGRRLEQEIEMGWRLEKWEFNLNSLQLGCWLNGVTRITSVFWLWALLLAIQVMWHLDWTGTGAYDCSNCWLSVCLKWILHVYLSTCVKNASVYLVLGLWTPFCKCAVLK
jgi:hypothetical protein